MLLPWPSLGLMCCVNDGWQLVLLFLNSNDAFLSFVYAAHLAFSEHQAWVLVEEEEGGGCG